MGAGAGLGGAALEVRKARHAGCCAVQGFSTRRNERFRRRTQEASGVWHGLMREVRYAWAGKQGVKIRGRIVFLGRIVGRDTAKDFGQATRTDTGKSSGNAGWQDCISIPRNCVIRSGDDSILHAMEN